MLELEQHYNSISSASALFRNSCTIRFQSDSPTLCFYVIVAQNTTLHLTFDKIRHHQALATQKKITGHELTAVKIYIATQELTDILVGKDVLPPYSASPFLKKGSPFQQRVWQSISRIGFGKTTTYGDIARELGNHKLARAVGQACNKNPVALLIPCHRVIGQKSLGGFAGGSGIKKKLLELEG